VNRLAALAFTGLLAQRWVVGVRGQPRVVAVAPHHVPGRVHPVFAGLRQGGRMSKPERDVEKIYATEEVVAKLRRLADALESGSSFRIQIAGERFRVPARAEFSIEHERGEGEEEVEFQLKWGLDDESDDEAEDAPVV
jgi:amphi-Trp domain-containing protein